MRVFSTKSVKLMLERNPAPPSLPCLILAASLSNPASAAVDGAWQGSADIAFSRSAGNTSATTYALTVDETRATEQNKTSLYASALYGKSQGEITADKSRISGRYDRNLSRRVFSFGLLEFERDRLANLKLRSNGGGGLGYHMLAEEPNKFDIFGGLSRSNSRRISGPSVSQSELLLSEESEHKLGDKTLLKQKLSYYPNTEDLAEFRTVFYSSLIFKLNGTVGLSLSLQNKYSSDSGSGIKHSDTVFLTGLNIKL